MSEEFRIDFSIMRRREGEEDFAEYGFGSTTAENSIDMASHMALSCLQNEEWDETESGVSGASS